MNRMLRKSASGLYLLAAIVLLVMGAMLLFVWGAGDASRQVVVGVCLLVGLLSLVIGCWSIKNVPNDDAKLLGLRWW
jgi:uncharacterized membrane protein YqjE